jgi:hypothetical protein
MAAAEPIYGKAIDVAVWPKSDADPGSLYRGGFEFIGVFCVGPLTIAQGRHKHSRSNVWHYGGARVPRESGLSFNDIAAGGRLSAGASPHQSEI